MIRAVKRCSYCNATSETREVVRVSIVPDRFVCPSNLCRLAFMGEQAVERWRGRRAAKRLLRR